MFDDPEFWKQLWDFIKSVTSDTIAPWVNSRLVYPTAVLVKPYIPKVRRMAAGQARDVLAFVREMPRLLQSRWLWPATATIPACVGLQAAFGLEVVAPAGGAVISIYVCAGAYFIIRGGIQRLADRFR